MGNRPKEHPALAQIARLNATSNNKGIAAQLAALRQLEG